jgi:hypothetical protein
LFGNKIDLFISFQMSSILLFRQVFQRCSANLISKRFTSSTPAENANKSTDEQFKKQIDDFIKSNKVAIFIKGEPDAPRMRKLLFFL